MNSNRVTRQSETSIRGVHLPFYAVAMLCVALALGFTLLLSQWLYPTISPLFLVAVMVSAWSSGWRAGMLATILSTLAINYFFIEPLHSLKIINLVTMVQSSTFLTAAGVICLLNSSRRTALRSTRKALQSLQASVSQEKAALLEATMAKDRLETVVSSINDGFYVLDRHWQFTYVNDRYCEIVQMSSSELLGHNLWEVFPAAIDTEAYVQFHEAMREQTPRHFDYLYVPWNCWYDHRVYPSPSGLTVLIADITDRKQAEAELLQSQSRLAFVLRSTEIGLWLNSLPLSRLVWDDRTRELFFIPPGVEPTIELFLSRLHPEDREPTRLAIESALQNHTLCEIEHRAVNPDTGEIRWIRSAGMATYEADGTPVRFDGINYDITDRKRKACNENFLSQLDLRLRQLPMAAMVEAALSSVGEFLKVDCCAWDRIYWAEDLVIVEEEWRRQDVLSTLGTHRLSEFTLPDLITLARLGQPVAVPDVTTCPYTAAFADNFASLNICAFLAVPCIHEGNWIATLVLNSQTVRQWRSDEIALLQEVVVRLWSLIEHSRAVQELRQSEAEFRQLANAMPQIVWISDATGALKFVNTRWTEYTGLTLEQSRDQAIIRQVIPAEDYERLHSSFIQAQAARSPYQSQFCLIQPDGNRLHFLMRAVPVLDLKGQIYKWYGTSTDVTALKQLEEELRQTNRIKDEFLAVLSHELRTPLNPILGWAKLLQQGKLDAARTAIALATIERNAQLQSKLIEDLLDISRILRGKLSLDMLPVGLCTVIAAALETIHLAAEAKSLQVQTLISPDVRMVIGDPGRLQQVVWNLLSNAVKFTPSHGKITVTLTQTDNHAQLQVIDTGKGIGPEFLPFVFEHFRQEDGATTRQFGGLGLGLAIVRQIVELHGGRATVESQGEGQGAIFTVQIPLAPQLSKPLMVKASPEIRRDLQGIRILVVDDDPDSREMIAFVLEQAGAIVNSFESGMDALQAIETEIPDIIVSDIGMPEMDGYMLMQQIRLLELGRQIPAIALTAYAGEFDRQQALLAGFQQHLSKPIEPNEIVNAISLLCSRVP